MAFVYLNDKNFIRAISKHPIYMPGCAMQEMDITPTASLALVGKKVQRQNKPAAQMKVAIICNWNQACGISTYTKYLIQHVKSKFQEIKIFSEYGCEASGEVVPCWSRGQNMADTIRQVLEWQPDFVLIQHEFGLFPKATHFLQMLQMLDETPYAVVLHSVYEHLDKAVCTSAIRNIICHTDHGKKVLLQTGNTSNITVIPHGCPLPYNQSELWNIFQTPYCIVQFGFGFFYKGVDIALDAIYQLKETQPAKYKDIFYCYLCSENEKTKNIQNEYFDFLTKKIQTLGLSDNVVIIRKYQSDETLNNYLRTSKLALFPYINNPDNTVYGASGAIRIAMANGIPVIASPSHLFDDLEGVVPRPDPQSLAQEIDKVFSNHHYRTEIVNKSKQFLLDHNWDSIAQQYAKVIESI